MDIQELATQAITKAVREHAIAVTEESDNYVGGIEKLNLIKALNT